MIGNGDPVNPYAPPSAPEGLTLSAVTPQDALDRVQRPARLLAYASAVNVIANGIMLPFLLPGALRPPAPSELNQPPAWVILIVVPLVAIGLPLAALIAAHRVRQPRPLCWAWTATVLALLPLGSGCWFLQLPFAFWLLHLLVKPEIRAALNKPPEE